MTHALRLGKRAFTVGVVVTTIAWSIGLAAFLVPLTANAAVSAGDLIKASLPAVYYYGSDGQRYVFPNEKTYFTWYSDFSSVVTVTDDELAAIPIGGNATYKPGVKMIKITTDPKVYAVGTGGSLHWVESEALAVALYGANWNQMIDDVPDAFYTNYSVGSSVDSEDDFDVDAETAAAASINVDKGLGEAPAASAGALTVALAGNTPLANSVLTDTGGSTDGAQALAPFTNLVFTASSAGPVQVNTLRLRRSGISADTDFSNVYLYDGEERLSESASFSSNYVTLNDATGLFTVPAGGSKTVMVKGDIANTSSSIAGKTFRFGLESSGDVTSDADSVGGSFPVNGNFMTGASVTDIATLDINTVTTFPATIDPGVENRELWRFNMVGANWDVHVERIKLTVVGTVAYDDLSNIRLTIGGVQLGETIEMMNTAKEAIFDMSDDPYVISAGQTKTVQVMGDVVGGTNRAFKFTVQKMADIVALDNNYGVYLKPNQADSFTLLEPETGDGTNINVGTLTITRNIDSPTGYITRGLTAATLARFNVKANGEDIKVTEFGVSTTQSIDGTSDLNQGKLYLDGVQVGTTQDLDSAASDDGAQTTWADDDGASDDDTEFTFGNSFIVPAGETKVLEVVADVVSGTSSNLSNNNIITVYLNQGADGAAAEGTAAATNAQGQVSMSTITSATASGLPLTVSTGTVTVIENSGFSDKTSSSPSGVQGGSDVKVGSFVITAGSGEGVDVTQIVLSDYAHPAANNMQNLKLMHGGVQIGTTVGTLNSSSSTYTFSPSPSISVDAGSQYVVDIYTNLLTSATNNSEALVPFSLAANAVTATGQISGLSATGPAAAVTLQDAYISTGGNLTILESADTPVADQLAMGETDVTMARFRLQASSAEGIRITQLAVSDDMSDFKVAAATGTLRNLKLYDGSTLLGTVSSLSETNSSHVPYAVFTALDVVIPKNGSKDLVVKADVSPYDSMTVTSSRHRILIKQAYKYDYNDETAPGSATDNTVTAWGVDSGSQITGTSLDYNGGGSIGDTDYDAIGEAFDVFQSKISLALHSTSPSGVSAAATEQTVAKFVISNQSPGGYTARVRNMNFDINSSGFSMTTEVRIKVYKSSTYVSANELANCLYCDSTACTNANFHDSVIEEGDFVDLDVSAGSSKTVYVTLNTSSASLDATDTETLSVGMETGDIMWDEDAYDATSDTYTEVPSLPVLGRTLSY